MPVYEFQCTKCEKKWELHIKLEEYREDIRCPECKGKMKRIFSTFAIHGFEHPNEVGSSADGDYDTKKDIALTLKRLESHDRLGELSKGDIGFYREYVKP